MQIFGRLAVARIQCRVLLQSGTSAVPLNLGHAWAAQNPIWLAAKRHRRGDSCNLLALL